MKVICSKCGRSMAFGSGLYLYRVPVPHTTEERRMMRKPFPEGDYLCLDCATDPSVTRLPTAPHRTPSAVMENAADG